jgi:hypothetical protein
MEVSGQLHAPAALPPGEELMCDWRKFHNEELHNVYSLRNIIRMIKSRRMR